MKKEAFKEQLEEADFESVLTFFLLITGKAPRMGLFINQCI
ncbi:hypothetical protein [Mucilaginibacter gynuensis]